MKKSDFSKAVFRIGKYVGTWMDLGTCFLSPIYSPENTGFQYIVTAYHVIAEAVVRGEQILTLENNGTITTVETVYIPTSEQIASGIDFAILRGQFTSKIDPLPFAAEIQPGPVIIRGRPNGLDTEFAFVRGICNGLEVFKNGNTQIIDLSIEDFYHSYTQTPNINNQISIPHNIWRGMSGSPIVTTEPDRQEEILCVIGLLTRITNGAVAGRAYGVPVSIIANVCKTIGLHTDLQKTRNTSQEVINDIELFAISDLFKGLEDPQRERQLWDWLSGLFYRGINSEKLLSHVIKESGKLDLDVCDLSFLHYFRGRIMLKEGKISLGEKEIGNSLVASKNASKLIEHRILALAKGRLVVESTSDNIAERMNLLLDAKSSIERLKDISTDYCVAEISSLLARQTASLFLKAERLNIAFQSQLNNLIHEHENLLLAHPIQLAKQDVVNTSLNILSLLWTG